MQVKLIKRAGTWADVYEAALFTVGKTSLGRTPSDEWKEKMIRAEHSPLRLFQKIIENLSPQVSTREVNLLRLQS